MCLVKASLRAHQMALNLGQFLPRGNGTQPTLTTGDVKFLFQLLGDFFDLILDIKVPTQEFANFSVLMVAVKPL